MAIAKKCDRCGDFYEPQTATIFGQPVNAILLIDRTLDNGGHTKRRYVDLCPRCLGSLGMWLNRSVDTTSKGEQQC